MIKDNVYNDYNEILNLLKQYIRQKEQEGVKEITVADLSLKNWVESNTVKLKDKDIKLAGYIRESSTSKTNKTKSELFQSLIQEVANCQKCPLGKTRIKPVFGQGNPDAELMFVGEGPGYEEDRQGLPFVGKAGKLLTKIIEAINFNREDVFITNIVKCHPMKDPTKPEERGNDRPPDAQEVNACKHFLLAQIEIIKPKIICALGTYAAQTLLNTSQSIGRLRGRFYDFNHIKLMPTLHPASCLYQQSNKKYVWEDMKMIRDELKKNRKTTETRNYRNTEI